MHDQSAGWGEHRMLVLSSLERIHDDMLRMRKEIADDMLLMRKEITEFRSIELGRVQKDLADLRLDVNMLKIKAAMFGAICGAIPSVISLIYTLTKK